MGQASCTNPNCLHETQALSDKLEKQDSINCTRTQGKNRELECGTLWQPACRGTVTNKMEKTQDFSLSLHWDSEVHTHNFTSSAYLQSQCLPGITVTFSPAHHCILCRDS